MSFQHDYMSQSCKALAGGVAGCTTAGCATHPFDRSKCCRQACYGSIDKIQPDNRLGGLTLCPAGSNRESYSSNPTTQWDCNTEPGWVEGLGYGKPTYEEKLSTEVPIKCKIGTFKGLNGCCSSPASSSYGAGSGLSAVRYYTGPNSRSGVVSITGAYSHMDCDGCPAGMTTLQEASMMHSDCKAKAGYYGRDPEGYLHEQGAEGYGAAPCAVGKYKINVGPAACSDCPDNSGTGTATGSNNINACGANMGFYGPNGVTPTACPAGTTTTTSSTDSSACVANIGFYGANGGTPTACPDNSGTGTNTGSTTIAACKAAEGYSGEDGGTFTACAADKYKSTTGAEACKDCPDNSGTGTATGSVDSTACVANIGFSGANGDTPTACAADKYKSTTGAEACKDCLNNSVTEDKTASTDSTACVANISFYGANGGTPTACPDNSGTGTNTGSTTIAACKAAEGYSGEDGGTFTACAADKYKDATGAENCTDCAAHLGTVNKTGSFAASACVANKGYSGKDGGIPTGCAAGKYKATTGAEKCTDCAANSATGVAEGSTSVDACVANKGYTGKDGDIPTACATGKYKDTTGASAQACDDCPPNTGTVGKLGVKAESGCLADAGYFGSSSSVTACPKDTFKTDTGAAGCTSCPTKSNTGGATGSTVASACVATSSGVADGAVLDGNATDSTVIIITVLAVVMTIAMIGVAIVVLNGKKDKVAPAPDRASLKEAFDVFDADGSGALDKEEFRNVMSMLTHKEGEQPSALSEAQFEAVFQEVDKDGSGVISFDEYFVWSQS